MNRSVPATRLALLLLTGLGACDAPAPLPVEEGVPEALARIRAETLSDVRYTFALQVPEPRSEAVTGTASIRFNRSDSGNRAVVLDFMLPAERVRGARVNGAEVAVEFVADHVVVPAEALVDGGENHVELDIIAGDEALNRNDGFLYTLFVPDRAHFSLPVFDQPDLKARVTWDLTVPASWVAIANGPLQDSILLEPQAGAPSDGGAGKKRLTFAESRPIPTYLLAFAAGAFQVEVAERDGRRLEMFHRETDQEKVARNREAIFDLHASALAWLEEYTGIDYPFQKFGFVLIPPFQYGGMEHPGAVTYRASSLFLEESATQGQILGRASLIAHETAHMWFGDLVTMKWFDDVWTKEVFANFMAAKIVHPSFPEVNHDLRFLLAHHPTAYGVDRTRGANAIRQPLENLNQAGTLYGAIIYQKAPMVMKQLERLVGEETFRDGLREYLSTFSYGNATWPDLIAILDPLHEDDLTAWSQVWVEEPGRPTILVDRVLEPGGALSAVGLRQEDPWERGRVWPQRLAVHIQAADEVYIRDINWGGGATGVLLEEPGVVPDFILPNGSGVEYGLFQIDDASLGYLVTHVNSLTDPVIRGTAWVTLWDAVLEERLEPTRFLDAALAAVELEESEQLLSRILGYAQTAYWRLLAPWERADTWARRFERALAGPVFERRIGEEAPTRAATLYRSYVSIALSPEEVARVRALWAGETDVPGVPLSTRDRTSLATALAIREVEGWQGILDAQEGAIENPDRLARFRFVRPALDADPEVRTRFFESLSDPANREREPWVLSALGALHHPLRAGQSEIYVLPALELLEEIQRTGDIFFPTRWMGATLGGHGSDEVVEIVNDYLESRPDYPPRLRQKILQALDMVERSARIRSGAGDLIAFDPAPERAPAPQPRRPS
jgi:aminopeptidase N